MKRILLLASTLILLVLISPMVAAQSDWRDLVASAFDRSDLVLSGTVQSVDDQTAVDGGHVYGLQITGQQKGSAQDQVTLRAGGFFYVVPLEVGESVMVFLRSSGSGAAQMAGPEYSLVEAEGLRPMVFRISGGKAVPVDSRLSPEFASVTVADLTGHLSSIKR